MCFVFSHMDFFAFECALTNSPISLSNNQYCDPETSRNPHGMVEKHNDQ